VADRASAQFSTYRAEAMVSRATPTICVDGSHAIDAARVAPSTSDAAGSRRRTRRAQKVPSRRAFVGGDRRRWLEMRKPEMTKKTSTPTYPPVSAAGQKWKTSTMRTATARSPWMSPRTDSAAARDRREDLVSTCPELLAGPGSRATESPATGTGVTCSTNHS
jgi:hypothetical protein